MVASDAIAAEGGFADPVFDSQAVFSAVMTAFSRPGTIVDIGGRVNAPVPLAPAAAAILAALADFDTPVWLEDKINTADVGAWIAFQTGAALAADPTAARFAVLSDPDELMLDRFSIGTSEYPDRSATVIVSVDGLDGGPRLTLDGPGIETETAVHPRGIGQRFLAEWKRNNALFPRGIDIVLVCGSRALALPRITHIGST
jgi:alpha-D-ribose 1-methylphosphonate 5-triphosphate synthase subunit PhnH